MLVPAILYKDKIIEQFQMKFYSIDMLYETGSNSQWCPSIPDEPDEGCFEYAIVDSSKNLIGYLSYRIDYYSSNAYNFGLMSFDPGNPIIGKDLFNKLEELVSTLHRVEWRMIGGNPVERHYDRFCAKYGGAKYILHDSVRDKNGKYHDNVVYEIIRLMDTLSENENLKEKEKCIPFATIKIDKNYLQKIVDEKLKSIELDIQAIRNEAFDDVMEKCEIQSRVICDAEQQIEYYGLSIRELRNIVAGLKQESEAKNEK